MGLFNYLAQLISPAQEVDADLLEALRYGVETVRPELDPARYVQSVKRIASGAGKCVPELFQADELKGLLRKDVVAEGQTQMAACAAPFLERLEARSGNRSRPLVAMLIPDGQSARTFLLGELMPLMRSWADLVVLTPYIEMDHLALHVGLNKNDFLPIPKIQKVHLDTLLRFAFYRRNQGKTYRIFCRNLEEEYGSDDMNSADRNAALWHLSAKFAQTDDYRKLILYSMYVYGCLFPVAEARTLLKRLSPDIIFNASAISLNSRLWTRAAALEGIPTVSNVISWDNMSNKTFIDEFSVRNLLWSQEMDADFRTSFPELGRRQRQIVGSPQFAPIIRKVGLVSWPDFCARHGLNARIPLVLYTTGSKTTFPAEPEFLTSLLRKWREAAVDTMQFMIRMHPKDRFGRYDELRTAFPDVPFTVAGEMLADDLHWLPTPEDIDLLVNQINHASVIVNVASTMTLEGFAVDKPSVNVGCDLGRIESIHYRLSDYYQSKHYADIIDDGAARLAMSVDETLDQVRAYLARPDLDSAARKKLFARKCPHALDSAALINKAIRSATRG